MTNYQDILKQIGYPTDILCLDFESYFDTQYSLKKMSTIEYINDPRFELMGLGWGSTGEIEFFSPDDVPASIPWYKHIFHSMKLWDKKYQGWDNVTVLVFNARSDITILQTKFGIVPKYIIDIKDLASHYDARMSHKLADLAKLFKLPHKGDTNQFKGLHWDTMTPEQRKALQEYTINDVDIEMQLFKILLPKLSNPETEVKLMRHTLDLWLHKQLKLDVPMATQLKTNMRTKMAKSIKESGYTLKQLRSKKFVDYLQAVLPEGETVPMKLSPKPHKKTGKHELIPALSKTDEECQQLLVHSKQEVRDLISARLGAKGWPTHIKRMSTMLVQNEVNGGLLRVPINYYGGHTGRWSGAEGYNLQNMGGRGRSGSGNDPLISQVRGTLTALPGYTFGIGDSAQIEARILAWLAGQQDLLDDFISGRSPYCSLATELFGHEVHKVTDDEKQTPEGQKMAIEYGFGKDGILGAGYGMGATKFYNDCLKNPSLRPLFDSGQYDFAFIQHLITTYRTKYSKIPEYWKRVETAFKQCIKFPHLKPKVGQVAFESKGTEVRVTLPSSRVLYYRHCRIKDKTIRHHGGILWGGSITENIDQSIARDLLGYWILECEKNGLPVVLHVHDEVVTMLSKRPGLDARVKLFYDIMCSLPDWASGLPIGTDEIVLSERYKK